MTSNQTFTVTSDETQVPADTNVAVTADVGDAEEVTIWLLDADGVDVDNGFVSFEADDDGDFETDNILDAGDGIVITDVDGVAVPNSTARTVDVEDGELELTLSVNAADTTRFVVFIAETDEAPVLDEDGAPEEAFGVTATITQQDVAGVALLDADRTTTTLFGVPATSIRPEGETVNVTAILFDGVPDVTDADDVADSLVGVDGELSWAIAEDTFDDDPADDLQGAAPDSLTGAQTVASGTATVSDGVANFSFTGGDDGETYVILVEWEGVEDSAYDGDDANAFVAANDVGAHGYISFTDDDAALASASFVDDDFLDGDLYVEVGATARPAVELVDQFGFGIAGIDVVIDDGNGLAQTRTTNADGVATFAFTNGDHETWDDITVTVLDDDGDAIDGTDPAVDGVNDDGEIADAPDVKWYLVVDSDVDFDNLVTIVADTDSDVVYVEEDGAGTTVDDSTAGEALQVDYSVAGQYVVDGTGSVSKSDFEDELPGLDLTVENADEDDVTTVFTLTPTP